MSHPLRPFRSINLVVPFHEVPSREWFLNALDIIGRFYRFISLSELEAYFLKGQPFNGACHVTFDDGHSSFYRVAYPVLREMGIPVTLFVSPRTVAAGANYWFQDLAHLRASVEDGAIKDVICELFGCVRRQIDPFPVTSLFLSMTADDMRRVLDTAMTRHDVRLPEGGCNITADQLREVVRSGLVTVGGHTLDHPVLSNETDQRAAIEIHESVAALSNMVNAPVSAFAYPNGTEGLDFGAREQRLADEAGVRVAFSTDVGFFGARTNRLAIPRGGCPSLQSESRMWSTGRLMFLSVWDRARRMLHPARASEWDERHAIRNLRIFLVRGS
jgi:peptidoglycan/xylan/chitin deacetylase (PgdA/CDA1 family)